MSKLKRKNSMHRACVKYVKKQQNGFIHPRDTSYEALAKALEHFAGTKPGPGSNFDRIKAVAPKLGIKFNPQKTAQWSTSNHVKVRAKPDFYKSFEWKRLRYETLSKYGGKCQCCGITSKECTIQVDHIKPASKYWHLRLDPNNLQVLCESCNYGKLNLDETDWR